MWKGQVRSLALEPSYFSIIASFLVPLLWIRIWGEGRKKELFLLAFFTFLIFMTKARTGILIYIGEVVFFVLLSLMVRYTNWWKTVLQVLLVTLFAFGVMVGGSAIVPSMVGYGNQVSIEDNVEDFYDSNVKSVTSASTRSNKARFSATVASFNVGLAHPVLGVGRGMESMYMMDAFPEFGQGDSEVQNWTKDINEKTFLGYSYPVLNQLTAIFAWFGAFGLILFLMPFFYVAREIVRNRFLLQDFRVIGLLVVFVGQFACFMSNAFFITYPLILGGLLCVLHQPMEFMGRSREAL